jgi:hypothetical protein
LRFKHGSSRVPTTGTERRTAVSRAEEVLRVRDLYARLAAGRAVCAASALRTAGSAEDLLAQSAQALEDAAGTLTLASDMYARNRERFSRRLLSHARALVALAAQFEQAADLARQAPSAGGGWEERTR